MFLIFRYILIANIYFQFKKKNTESSIKYATEMTQKIVLPSGKDFHRVFLVKTNRLV
jgi:hypothetical protein